MNRYLAEEKIRVFLVGFCGEESIAALCRLKGIAESLYYKWSKEFIEAGNRQLSGDTAHQTTAPEVKELRSEALALKECVADLTFENRLLKKIMIGDGIIDPLSWMITAALLSDGNSVRQCAPAV